MAGQDDDLGGDTDLPHPFQGLHAPQAGHLEIQEDNLDIMGGQCLEGVFPALHALDGVSHAPKLALHQDAKRFFVVDHQDAHVTHRFACTAHGAVTPLSSLHRQLHRH